MGIRKLFPEKSAQDLLAEYRQSGSDKPFEEIMRRYAAMVFGVCLRVTGDKHDAEDATQAVFLSLALQAKTAREITYIGPWLQKVAHRLALDVKKSKTRRRRREEKLAEQVRHHANGRQKLAPRGTASFAGGNGHLVDPADAPGAEELKQILLDELNQLPAKYRLPLMMHYFGGLSREEMAEQLKCNPSTLGVRVHRGKSMLGVRLHRRGINLTAVSLGVMLEHVIQHGMLHPIIGSATAAGGAAGHGLGAAIASAKVIEIIRVAAKSIVYAKMRYAVAILLVLGSAAIGTRASVVEQIGEQIREHLPSLHLMDWIKPMFRLSVPSLQAEVESQDPLAPLQQVRNLAGDQPPAIIHLASDESTIGAPTLLAPPAFAQSSRTPRRAANPVPDAPGTSSDHPEPALNALAQAIVTQPFTSKFSLKDFSEPQLPVGADNADANQDSPSSASDDPRDNVISAGDFLLGAGGGGGSGKPQVYVLPANVTMRSSSMVIDGGGDAIFHQLGGVNAISGNLTIAQQKGSSGAYVMDGGALTAQNETIGDKGDGDFSQAGGSNVVQESLIIGKSGKGKYTQTAGLTAVAHQPASKADDSGADHGLVLGVTTSGTGTYALSGGSLSADPQQVGVSGTGKIVQTGGSNSTGALNIAINAGSDGQYDLTGGQLEFHPRSIFDAQPVAAIQVGVDGEGVFTLGNDETTGSLAGDGASVVIRGAVRGNGTLVGWGKVNLTGVLVNNGQVVADGYNRGRTLDLSSFSSTTSSIENLRWGGTEGWFARRDGKLTLPPIPVAAGTGTYTWGEDAADTMIDLVNSVRFTVNGARHAGDVSISLLSVTRHDVPTLPTGHHFIGIWSFDASSLGGYDDVDLTVRYDDAMAKTLGLDENILKLWEYNPDEQRWIRIMDGSFNRDPLDHLLSGDASDFSYFAVSAPEPGGIALLIAGGLMLRRRRRAKA